MKVLYFLTLVLLPIFIFKLIPSLFYRFKNTNINMTVYTIYILTGCLAIILM